MDAPIAALSGGTISRLATEFHVEWPLLCAQMLNFTVVAFVLYRFAFKPLLRLMDERKRTIAAALTNAEEVERRLAASSDECALKLREAGGEAEEILRGARDGAKTLAQEERKRTEREMVTLREKELGRISEERDAALRAARRDLRSEAAALALKILKEGVDEDAAAKFTAASVHAIAAGEG
jgi:F-type H+-transporting ATPase subunit b